MGYSIEGDAKRGYNRIRRSLCRAESSAETEENLPAHDGSAGYDEEAEDLPQNLRQMNLDTYAAAELEVMLSQSDVHTQALKSRVRIKN